jgi:hypothetical protein
MPRFQWLEAYELTFFQSLVDSIHDGLRPESLLKPEAWRRAMKALQDTHDITITKSQLANKYDNTKKKFRVWRALREEPGFGYDLATGCVTAPDQVWDAYLEVNTSFIVHTFLSQTVSYCLDRSTPKLGNSVEGG